MKEIAICGCPRSGTTALANLLNHDDSTIITNETCCYIWGDNIAPFTDKIDREENNYEFTRPFLNKGLNPRKIFSECKTSRDLPSVIHSHGYEVVGDKLPDYIYSANFNVLCARQDVYIIIMIRDVRGFIASSTRFYNKGMRSGWCFPDGVSAEKFWIEANIHLINAVLRARMRRLKILKYETVCENADKLVRNLSSFVDFEFKIPEPANIFFPVHKEVSEYKISSEATAIMELFGYEV